MTTLHVVDASGRTHTVNATDGLSVMEATRTFNIGIAGECEGSIACATCHVWIDAAWKTRVGEPSEQEAEMLDCAFNVRETSRLSCQIRVSPDLDGLLMTIPHKS
jgi:2Fe-2S ferredoxin